MGIKILGSSSYLPNKIIKNDFLERKLGLEENYIEPRTGVIERRSFDTLKIEEIYSKVAIDAIKDSRLKSIDSLVIGKDVVERNIENVYANIKNQFDRKGIEICNDYSTTSNCPGCVSAIGKESQKIKEAKINNSLIISVSRFYDLINKKDIGSSVLWGDGASAIVLGKSEEESDLIYFNEIKDNSLNYLQVKEEGNKMYCEMNGRGVTSYVLKSVPSLIEKGIEETGIKLKDIDYFLFHQANGKILDSLIKRMNIPTEKVPKNVNKYGNTGIASTLIIYDELAKLNKIKKGMHLMFIGFGLGDDGIGMQSNIAIFRK